MEDQLIAAFQTGLTTDNQKLREANEYLASIRSSENLVQSCINLSLTHLSQEIRLISVIYLKNLTKTWNDTKREFSLPSQDKIFLKSNILNFLLFSIPDKIRAQYQEIALNIAKAEFPWDEILFQIDGFLGSGDIDKIYAALVMISQISKVFEHKINDRRDNMKILVSRYFKKLGMLMKTLMNESEERKFRFIAVVLQIYWTCFYIDLPEEQASIENLQDWLSMCRDILVMDMTGLDILTPDQDPYTLEENPKWQCKKWTAQILHRFFNRYFNTLYLKDHNKFIGEYFQANWAVPLSYQILTLLLSSQTHFFPNTFSNYLLKFLVQAFRLKVTADSLLPLSEKILIEVALPMMQRTLTDEEMWKNDPVEFIRKETDIGKAYYSASNSAGELLKAICEQSSLEFFLKYLELNMTTENLIVKESLLHAFGVINKVIRVQKVQSVRIENILLQFVSTEFKNPVGFLRGRACWAYSCYSDLLFSNTQHQELVLNNICALMVDSDLPVRIEAATALPKFLDWPRSKAKIASEIKQVLQIYIELMNLIDYEELIEALEDIVGNFSSEIEPYALDLSKCLTSAFLSMSTKENSDNSIMAAESILNTLGKLIDTLDESTEILVKISSELEPIFDLVFNQADLNYFDASLSILSSLLYYCPDESLPNLFKYASSLYNYIIANGKVKDFVKDNLGDIYSPLSNYLKKYKTQAQESVSLFISLGSILLNDGYIQLPIGCKIFISILEHCSINSQAIPQVLINSYHVFTSTESKKVKILFVQILMVSCWRAPVLTFDYMKKLVCVNSVFSFIIQNHMMLKEEVQLLHGICGLCSLFVVFEQIQEIEQYLGELLSIVLQMWKRLQGIQGIDADGEKIGNCIDDDDEDLDEGGRELYESIFEEVRIKEVLKVSLTKSSQWLNQIQLSPEDQQSIVALMT